MKWDSLELLFIIISRVSRINFFLQFNFIYFFRFLCRLHIKKKTLIHLSIVRVPQRYLHIKKMKRKQQQEHCYALTTFLLFNILFSMFRVISWLFFHQQNVLTYTILISCIFFYSRFAPSVNLIPKEHVVPQQQHSAYKWRRKSIERKTLSQGK